MFEDKKLFDDKCKGYNYVPLALETKKNVYAIGDLHGDYELTIKVLKLCGVIDNNLNWIGKDTYVVQVGDQLDNCRPVDKKCDDETLRYDWGGSEAEDLKVLKFMTELDAKASKYSSRVISLFGNHELMNVNGNMNYVSYDDMMKLGKTYDEGKNNRVKMFAPGGEYAVFMACTRVPMVIIGNFMFVHAGIVKEFTDKFGIKGRDDMYKVSTELRKWLLGSLTKDNIVNILGSKPYSLFWDRILGAIPHNTNIESKICRDNLQHVLDVFKIGVMIIGHTPTSFSKDVSGINNTCSGKLWRIDTGSSHGFDRAAGIVGDQVDVDMGNLRKAQVLHIKYKNNGDLEEESVKILS